MIQAYSWGELALAAAVFILAANELVQLYAARRKGLTTNVSRLVMHFLVTGLMLVYVGYALWWRSVMSEGDLAERIERVGVVNYGYILLGMAVGVVLSYQLTSHLQAIKEGLTTNVSRIFSHLVMLLLLIVMIGLSLLQWDAYQGSLEDAYREGIPTVSTQLPALPAAAPAEAGGDEGDGEEPVDEGMAAEPQMGDPAGDGQQVDGDGSGG